MKKLPLLPFAVLLALPCAAAPHAALLDAYAATAKADNPAFSGFSPARGEKLHSTRFATGKPETPACTACHGDNARSAGRTPSGKRIEPMALSLSLTPTRYGDPAKVEKWFKRNCLDVLGRVCTAAEKGDWLSFMLSQ